jgi:hypothetical protein
MYRNFYKLLESQYLFGHFLDEPNGMMEYWNVGLRLVEPTSCRAYASERILGMKSGKRTILQEM